MKYYDVIVIGAGPSGSTSALELDKFNLNVLLVDKLKFPRYKPCAGGLTIRAIKLLKNIPKNLIENCPKYFVLGKNREEYTFYKLEKPVTKMVEREDFDFQMLKKCSDNSIKTIVGVNVELLEYKNFKFYVKIDDKVYCSSYLIGADGAYSQVNRKYGLVENKLFSLGIETNISPSNRKISDFNQTFDFNSQIKGYYWIFPKKNHLCVGLYSTSLPLKNAKNKLKSYIRFLGINSNFDYHIKGHLIPHWGIKYKQKSLPVILVGDAAGFCDYTLGEGISYAIQSAKIASRGIIKSIHNGQFCRDWLQNKYEKKIINNLRISHFVGKLFYENIEIGYRIMTNPLIYNVLIQGNCMGLSYNNLLKKLPSLLFRLNVSNIKKSNTLFTKF